MPSPSLRSAPHSFSCAGPAGLEAHGLVKVFGLSPALVGVDLVVPRGTVCAVLGGNGAGKTTLLRCAATALRPTLGTVLILGRDVRRQAGEVRRLVELVPSVGGAYPELTARENLRFALRMRGLAVREARLSTALERAGLGVAADDPVRTYSTGMGRRLWLARVLLTDPEVLLVDEPYAGLDEDGRGLVDAVVTEARAGGRTVVLATHDRERVAAVADAMVWLEGGAVIAAPVAVAEGGW